MRLAVLFCIYWNIAVLNTKPTNPKQSNVKYHHPGIHNRDTLSSWDLTDESSTHQNDVNTRKKRQSEDSVCETLTGDGELTSPGYASEEYDRGLDVCWHLVATEGMVIQIYFGDVHIEAESSCSFDAVVLFDGEHLDVNDVMLFICGTGETEALESTGRTMTVYFHSDGENPTDDDGNEMIFRGFHASFKSVDPQDLGPFARLTGGDTDAIGRLEVTLNYQNWGPVCEDYFTETEARVLCRELGFDDVATPLSKSPVAFEVDGSTIYDYKIYNVDCHGDETSLRDCDYDAFSGECVEHGNVGVMCGNHDFGGIRLVGGEFENEGRIELLFGSYWGTMCDDAFGDVDATVLCREIGRDTGAGYNSGLPVYGAHYGQGVGIIWLDNAFCTGTEDTILHCTSDPGKHDCSHGNDAGVVCLMDEVEGVQGGNSYGFEGLSCTSLTESGNFSSPLYDGDRNYDTNVLVCWTLTAEDGQTIELEFLDFYLEYDNSCSLDSVTIYNGGIETAEDNLLAIMCGENLPSIQNSQGSSMTVVFKSNHQSTRRGFQAKFYFINQELEDPSENMSEESESSSEPESSESSSEPESLSESESLSELESSESSSEPESSESSSEPESSESSSESEPSDVPESSNESESSDEPEQSDDSNLSDESQIEDEPQTSDEVLDDSEEQDDTDIPTRDNPLGCIIVSGTSEIQSPGWDDEESYEADLYVCWIVVANLDQKIELVFTDFELERSRNCVWDALSVFSQITVQDDDFLEEYLIGDRLCGDEHPDPVQSETLMAITFKTDYRGNYLGFKANVVFEENSADDVIGGASNAYECGNIHCYNGVCEDGQNCVCNLGYAGIVCETDIDECFSDPCLNQGTCVDDIASFTCQCTEQYTGDLCEIHLPTEDCEDYTNNAEILMPANWTGRRRVKYSNNLHKCWVLRFTPDTNAELIFEDFDIETEDHCQYDNLTIYSSYPPRSSTFISTLCGYGNPDVITGTSGTFYMMFSSDHIVTKTGFKANFVTQQNQAGPESSFECGIAPLLTDPDIAHIVNGIASLPGQWPWSVDITVDYAVDSCTTFDDDNRASTKGHICGGTLIGEHWILTAAHCLYSQDRGMYDIEDLLIVVGEHDRSVVHGNEEAYSISEVIKHDRYDHTSLVVRHDIALLKTTEPVVFNDYVRPACVHSETQGASPEQQCFLSGWGSTLDGYSGESAGNRCTQTHIRQVVKDHYECSASGYPLTHRQLCVTSENDEGACQGDSGAGLLCQSSVTDRYFIDGVTSFGFSTDLGCDTRAPVIYTNVTYMTSWIVEHTGGDVQPADDILLAGVDPGDGTS